MSKGISFQAFQYTLIIRDATGAKITGTGSIYDLEKTRTFAASIFRVSQRAAFVDIHPYVQDGSYADTALETIHRTGTPVATLPPVLAKEPEPEVAEMSGPEVHVAPGINAGRGLKPVEQAPVELSSAPRRRDRRGGKAKQEEP